MSGIPIAGGLYVAASFIKHSCRPNVWRRFDGFRMRIIALDTIDTNKDIILISYVMPMETRAIRQKVLKDVHYIDCKCKRCSSPLSDDASCIQFSEVIQNLPLLAQNKNYKLAHQMAKKGIELSEEVLGKYSVSGTSMHLKSVEYLFNDVLIGGNRSVNKKKFLNQVKELRKNFDIFKCMEMPYYQFAVQSFEQAANVMK